ncbi:Pre-mRNA-splicing factor 18 [Fusarium oxysporum f. sp. albedinis]|nr:Pre-mRNA-splicing factor 18 [Fusarium oxysporum f. sp. albedinis]
MLIRIALTRTAGGSLPRFPVGVALITHCPNATGSCQPGAASVLTKHKCLDISAVGLSSRYHVNSEPIPLEAFSYLDITHCKYHKDFLAHGTWKSDIPNRTIAIYGLMFEKSRDCSSPRQGRIIAQLVHSTKVPIGSWGSIEIASNLLQPQIRDQHEPSTSDRGPRLKNWDQGHKLISLNSIDFMRINSYNFVHPGERF